MSDFFLWSETLERIPEEDDLGGYHAEATDGHIGTVMEYSDAPGESYLVIDTGSWILAKRVLLPAGMVDRVDHEHKRVYIDATRAQIKAAPEFDERAYKHSSYHEKLEKHYK